MKIQRVTFFCLWINWLTCERGQTSPAWPRLCWRCDRHKRTLRGSAAETGDVEGSVSEKRRPEAISLHTSTLSHSLSPLFSRQIVMTTCDHSYLTPHLVANFCFKTEALLFKFLNSHLFFLEIEAAHTRHLPIIQDIHRTLWCEISYLVSHMCMISHHPLLSRKVFEKLELKGWKRHQRVCSLGF